MLYILVVAKKLPDPCFAGGCWFPVRSETWNWELLVFFPDQKAYISRANQLVALVGRPTSPVRQDGAIVGFF